MSEPPRSLRADGTGVALAVSGVPPRLVSGGGFRGRTTSRPRGPGYAFGVLLVGLVGVYLASAWGVPLPQCGLREATGLPCPICGSTRAALALARGDVLRAWRGNPLATVGMVGTVLVFAAGLLDRARGTRWVERAGRWACRTWGWRTGVVVLAANWLYLVLTSAR